MTKLEKCERYFWGSGHTQRVAGSATKASFNASITPASSDSIAVLTFGIVIKISLIFYDVRNILKFYTSKVKYNAILFDQKLSSKKLFTILLTIKRKIWFNGHICHTEMTLFLSSSIS
ncbi:MAG TPA: hypothetical protein VFR65_04500 [Nitrososphaeraceae archaeon]|nr:hypothetical protein [Nitrososphaeraceae archaeon]